MEIVIDNNLVSIYNATVCNKTTHKKRGHMLKNLKMLREKANLTQQQLSDKTGVCRSQIAKVEIGICNISMQKAQAIAKELNVTLDDLIKETR
jgi:transcriptional regulator with XRE-family HTH domain